MVVKMEIDLERGFAPWKEMFIDNEHKLKEHGGKLVFAGTEKDNERVDYEKGIKLKMIFIYFVIFIISLFGLIFLLDTFKYNLSIAFPGIVPLFDSLYETLLDLKLFFKDLTN